MAKHIKVNSVREAWEKANELFPTDYIKDDNSSANAGYPIYKSTASNNVSWISDINTCLELTIVKGDYQSSETIYIDIEPNKAILSKGLFKSIESEFTDKLDKAKARMEHMLEELDDTDIEDNSIGYIVGQIKKARIDINTYTELLEQLHKECTY